jgi:hypothetical protein
MNSPMMKRMAEDKVKIYWLVGAFLGCYLVLDPSFAVTVEALKEPIKQLKTEIFEGWMMAVKIGAAASGIVMSAFRGSFAPFGIGAGLSMGIHVYDKYLGDGATGALI